MRMILIFANIVIFIVILISQIATIKEVLRGIDNPSDILKNILSKEPEHTQVTESIGHFMSPFNQNITQSVARHWLLVLFILNALLTILLLVT